jgi:sugar lactone lactonase YvrE
LTFNFNNTLYIADYQNNRIQMYLPGASIGTTVAGFSNGIQVTNSSGFAYPADVVVDSDGNIYVADSYNSRVQFWSNGASYGTTIAGSGK